MTCKLNIGPYTIKWCLICLFLHFSGLSSASAESSQRRPFWFYCLCEITFLVWYHSFLPFFASFFPRTISFSFFLSFIRRFWVFCWYQPIMDSSLDGTTSFFFFFLGFLLLTSKKKKRKNLARFIEMCAWWVLKMIENRCMFLR